MEQKLHDKKNNQDHDKSAQANDVIAANNTQAVGRMFFRRLYHGREYQRQWVIQSGSFCKMKLPTWMKLKQF
jgi:hypothetical protein